MQCAILVTAQTSEDPTVAHVRVRTMERVAGMAFGPRAKAAAEAQRATPTV